MVLVVLYKNSFLSFKPLKSTQGNAYTVMQEDITKTHFPPGQWVPQWLEHWPAH